MSNLLDRFHAAVVVIAGHGKIKQRLVSAFEDHLSTVEDEMLPDIARRKFAKLQSMMSGVEPLSGEGHIKATVRKMSVRETEECSRRVLELYTELVRLDEGTAEAAPVNIGDYTRVPPFLVKTLNT